MTVPSGRMARPPTAATTRRPAAASATSQAPCEAVRQAGAAPAFARTHDSAARAPAGAAGAAVTSSPMASSSSRAEPASSTDAAASTSATSQAPRWASSAASTAGPSAGSMTVKESTRRRASRSPTATAAAIAPGRRGRPRPAHGEPTRAPARCVPPAAPRRERPVPRRGAARAAASAASPAAAAASASVTAASSRSARRSGLLQFALEGGHLRGRALDTFTQGLSHVTEEAELGGVALDRGVGLDVLLLGGAQGRFGGTHRRLGVALLGVGGLLGALGLGPAPLDVRGQPGGRHPRPRRARPAQRRAPRARRWRRGARRPRRPEPGLRHGRGRGCAAGRRRPLGEQAGRLEAGAASRWASRCSSRRAR